MRICAKCDRIASARGMCNQHYELERKHGDLTDQPRLRPQKAEGVHALAQKGQNEACVDCQAEPLFGGMRCLDCFQARCDRIRHATPHQFAEPPSYGCYNRGCRCRECRMFSAKVKRRARLKHKATA
jgi:hypothetical protein